MTKLKTDVLIVGAGPVGLLAALLLEKTDLDYIVVERRPTLHDAPQAHVISSRSLEICRSLGISDGPIRAAGPNPADMASIRWVDRLVGRDLGVFHLARDPGVRQRMLELTPTPIANLSQDQFETMLFDALPDSRKVRFEHTWQGLDESPLGCLSRLTGPNGEEMAVESRYVIGADGAGSPVRKSIGATMVGPANIQTFVNVHFSANLREHLNGREGLLYWVMERECEGTFIAHDIDSNWIFMKTVDAGESTDPIDEEKYGALLRKAIGVDVDLTIHSMNAWRMTAQISDAYQSRRVFLVGDAAHRFPPTGGIGMNTGFQDAHNLVWKIAMVEQGWDAALLDTYGTERKPVAETNSAQSLKNAHKMAEVAHMLDADGDASISFADIDTVMADPKRCAGVQKAINNQAAHFNMSGLDLGFCYGSGAVLVSGSPPQSEDPVSEYLPSTTPGGRMPHAWLISGDARLSTLDLVRYDELLVISSVADTACRDAVERLVDSGYPVSWVVVADGADIHPADRAFAELFADDVLVVRPDGHIAARMSAASADEVLESTVKSLFPRG